MSFKYYLILGIVTMILVAFPIGIYIPKILNKQAEGGETFLTNLLSKFFSTGIVLNLISVPVLGINTVFPVIPSIIIGGLTLIIFLYSKNKSKAFNSAILDKD